jgi:16S rRNA (guanine527-N7)-methyltransferase
LSPTEPEKLAAALAAHDIALPPDQVTRLAGYCGRLWDWNAKLNLTRHTDYEKFVARDLVDTLVLSRHLRGGERVLDVGTGGGVPGLVLAILRDDLDIAVCDSVAKKARAVGEIITEMGLDVPVYPERAEAVLKRERFGTLTIRAVDRMKKLLTWLNPCRDAFDRMLLIKGPAWVDERGEARHFGLLKGLALRRLESYPMPGTESESVLLQVCKAERLAEFPPGAAS